MVRVNDEEHREFTKFAEANHTTVSALMRQCLHEKMDAAEKAEAA